MITDNYYPKIGGVEYCVHALSYELSKLGHSITVITNTLDHPSPQKEDSFVIKRVSLLALIKVLMSPSTQKHSMFYNFDIIHAHSLCSPRAILGLLIAKRMRKPSILTSHSIYRRIDKYPTKLLAKIVNHVICVSNTVVANMKYLRKNITTYLIPNGFQPNHNSLNTQNNHLLNNKNELIIGTVTRLTHKKNTSDFIKIASSLLKVHNNLKFIIIGDGPQRKKLEKQANQLNISQYVTFTGRLEPSDTLATMRQFDIFALTSPHEAFGIVILEAIYNQIPCVAFANNGTADIITSGKTGYLAHSLSEMINYILFLIENPSKRIEIANNATSIINKFQWNEIAQKTVSIYLELLSIPHKISAGSH